MMKLLSLFSGIGAFEKALENLGEPVELINYCEIDKYASKAFALIHNVDESKNLRDVCSINTNELPRDIDLITYGFPCQDISNAGKQRGFVNDDGSLTRSGLFFTALHIIEETKPKIAIAENVKALTGKKFASEFQTVLTCLNQAGYQNYWSVLNAKDYGVPQNRERVFIISIRNDIAHGFDFPQEQELKLRLKDLLEENVDEKYFLSEKLISFFKANEKKQREKGNGFRFNVTDGNVVAKAVTTLAGHRMDDNFIDESLSIKEVNKIRKLTPKECFRLMGFDDKDCDILVTNGISNTQLYKMAGNSIVVDVLESIFLELFTQYSDVFPNNIKKEYTKQIDNLDVQSDWEARQITIFDVLNYKEEK